MTTLMKTAALAILAVLLLTVPAMAQAPAGSALNYSIIDLIRFGGWVGYVIILLSIVAMALVIEYALSIRPKAMMPEQELDELRRLMASERYDEVAGRRDDDESCFVTTVVARGLRERGRGYDAVIKAMEDMADELTGRLLRKIEHLNIIANIAPMLGLLGTVMGMVNSFNQISVAVGGVDPRRLAGETGAPPAAGRAKPPPQSLHCCRCTTTTQQSRPMAWPCAAAATNAAGRPAD